MGKKVRAKARNPRKVHARSPAGSAQSVDPTNEAENVGEVCSHYSKSNAELSRILSGIIARDGDVCENCGDDVFSEKKTGKEKRGKQQKKKGGALRSEAKSESGFVWACLDCGKCFCGGPVRESVPLGHARRHFSQERHPWAARIDDPSVGWCYLCNSGFRLDMPEVESDVEDGKLSGKDERGENGFENSKVEGVPRRVVRGLSNLGNTCFFNSVMQNLFALDMLRESMFNLGKPVGPLALTMKKLFEETSSMTDMKGVLNPKNLFGCICSKSPQFRGYDQQDSHELLRCLLDGLHVEETNSRKLDSSCEKEVDTSLQSSSTLVDKIFGGQLSSTVCCVDCGHTSTVIEAFLDLSLPVPSKKPPPKKIPPPPKKPVLKDRNKSRRFREKENGKRSVVVEEKTTESVVPVPEPEQNSVQRENESKEDNVIDIPASEPAIIGPATMDASWMDYLDEPSSSLVSMDPDNEIESDFAVQDSESGDKSNPQKADNLYTCGESQVDNMSKEIIVSQDSCGKNYSGDEVNSSSMQDSGVILLPYEEINPNKEVASTSESSNKLSLQVSTLASDEQEEVEFDGFGNLFNEPEVTSHVKGDNGMTEDIGTTFSSNKFSDYNQEEVDNSDAPVSVNSCLALFTKPELLTGDHAWYCERCSEVSSHEVNGKRKEKVHAELIGSQREMKDVAPNLQVPCSMPIDSKASSSADVTSTSNMDSTFELPSTLEKASNAFGRSGDATNGDGEGCEDCKSTSTFSDGQHIVDYVAENQDVAGSGSMITTLEKDASMNNSLAVQGDAISSRQAQECPISLSSNDESIMPNSIGNGNFEVHGAEKRRSKRIDQLRQVKESKVASKEPEKRKVKRDATKRILINRAPLVLTIHLKRFSQDARGRLTKLRGHVCFQETIDLRPYLDPRCAEKEKCTYRLVGVVEHSGSMSGGHYIAYVRGEMGKGKMQKDMGSSCWFYASDAHVRLTSLSEVLQSEAYILFYERV